MSPPTVTARFERPAARSPACKPASGPSPSLESRTTLAPGGIAGSAAAGLITTTTSSLTSPTRSIARCRSEEPWYRASNLSEPNLEDPPPARTIPAMALTGASGSVLLPPLYVLEPEPALDAEMSARHVVVRGRRDLHDRVVLNVELQLAPHPAVRTDRVRDGLSILVPRAGAAHVVF